MNRYLEPDGWESDDDPQWDFDDPDTGYYEEFDPDPLGIF